MATLSQLYNAYLQDDPNVGEMTYDPFGWNIEQTFADQDDDDGDTGDGGSGERSPNAPLTGGTFGPFGEGTVLDPKDFGLDSNAMQLGYQPVDNQYYLDDIGEGTIARDDLGLAESIIGDRGLRTIRKRREKRGYL